MEQGGGVGWSREGRDEDYVDASKVKVEEGRQ